MNFLESMQERYATKEYEATKNIALNDLKELLEVLRLSPSSINSQPWHFTVVRDEELKSKFANVSFHNKQKIHDCDTLIIFQRFSDVTAFEKRSVKYIPEPAWAYYTNKVKPQGGGEIKNWFTHQIYLALGVLLSACALKKIDSTPMEGIDVKAYDELLKNEKYETVLAVALGYRNEEDAYQPSKRIKSRLDNEKIFTII